uniref:hypothetical protein n=1 Tax=Candidatus Electrothrix sp. TaxID=2170559 RepID=UPI00405690C5
MALVRLATLPYMILVQADPAIIRLSRPINRPGNSRASQGRHRRLEERAACSETLQVVHQALWGARWVRSADSDDADAAADKNPASAWFCQPGHLLRQRALLDLLARRVWKVYINPGFFVFGAESVNLMET